MVGVDGVWVAEFAGEVFGFGGAGVDAEGVDVDDGVPADGSAGLIDGADAEGVGVGGWGDEKAEAACGCAFSLRCCDEHGW